MLYATVVYREHDTLTPQPGESVVERNVFQRRGIHVVTAKMIAEPFPIVRDRL
jgi:hypothetical protein